jgi:hypothetical protein
MTLADAIGLIDAMHAKMTRDYKRAVFDEYAIMQRKRDKFRLAWYRGPREVEFRKNFVKETAALRAEILSNPNLQYQVGDFQFTHEGHGSQSESFLILAPGLVLICGNTRLSMGEISQDRLWISAQQHFVYMSERFAVDPLVLDEESTEPE